MGGYAGQGGGWGGAPPPGAAGGQPSWGAQGGQPAAAPGAQGHWGGWHGGTTHTGAWSGAAAAQPVQGGYGYAGGGQQPAPQQLAMQPAPPAAAAAVPAGAAWDGYAWSHAAPTGDALQRFHSSFVYHREGTLHELYADMDQLRQFDRDIEQRRSSAGKWMVGLWITSGVTLFIGFILWPLLLLLPFLVVPAIIFTSKHRKAKQLDLENRRYELLSRLVELLGRDMDPAQPAHVYLDLRSADHPSKLRGVTENKPWTIRHFQDEWLWMRGTLQDQSVFTLTATERRRIRSGWKRGASGKLKHKTKSKSKFYFGLQLSLRRKKHPHIDAIANAGHGAVQLPPHAMPKSLSCKKGVIRLKTVMPWEWDEPSPGQPASAQPRASTAIAAMFLSLYQMVNLSNQQQKKANKAAASGMVPSP